MWADQVGLSLALHLQRVGRWPSLCVEKPTQMQKQDMVLGARPGRAGGASVAGLPEAVQIAASLHTKAL